MEERRADAVEGEVELLRLSTHRKEVRRWTTDENAKTSRTTLGLTLLRDEGEELLYAHPMLTRVA